MKPYIYFFLALCISFLRLPEPCASASEQKVIYVIPVKGMIERGLVYVIRRGVGQAVRENADAIIFEMDTPGGRLDSCQEIINIISGLKLKTYTYVNPNAMSAGAIIAMATDHIYMAPGGLIGDAMPIMMSPIGDVQEMSDDLKEKAVSPTSALIRSAAQRKNHDPKLAECMVRRELEYKIGDEVICREGQLLTLTNIEAERMVGEKGKEHPLLSEGTAENLDVLLEKIGYKESKVVELTVSPAEKIARYIELLSALFLIGGLICIYIEFKTPGFGLPGITGIFLLAIWFWGYHVAGMAGMGELILFTLGVTLLFVEIFLIPGFGVVGLTGITLIIVSLMMAMVEHYPGTPWYQPPLDQIQRSVIVLGSSLVVTFILGVILARFLPETHVFQRLMLASSVSAADGYQASARRDDLVGLRGTAETHLRPAGIGIFGDKRLNVVTHGTFIEKGTPIVIAETHGSRTVVDTLNITSGAGSQDKA